MNNIELRECQKDAIKSINDAFVENDECLIKMFCGSGKSRIIFYYILNNNYKFQVIIVPSIILVSQFNHDYFCSEKWENLTAGHKFISVCSKEEKIENNKNNATKYDFTTNDKKITKFIDSNVNGKKIIICTYQSLNTLIESVNNSKSSIDLIIYDEAHHIVGSTIQQLVFHKKIDDDSDNESNDTNNTNNSKKELIIFEKKPSKTIYFTATPKNDNNITMLKYDFENEIDFDEDEIKYDYTSDCGKFAYEYTHIDAVKDNVCNDFEICIDFTTEFDMNKSTLQAIARSILQTGNSRVLTMHAYSESNKHEGKSNVKEFKKNKELFVKEFNKILEEEFPQHKNKYKKISFDGIIGSTTKNKKALLEEFDNTKNDEIYILSSCNTIGEGVDTKNANNLCFVDPKQSYVSIVQNIGRVCRKTEMNEKPATILIPCYVDSNKYKDCKTDEERDLVIRNDINSKGNFNGILNVLSALRENDPKYYDLCLHYPDTFTQKELEDNFNKQGFVIDKTCDDLHENISKLTNISVDKINKLSIDDIPKVIDKCIEIHTNEIKEPIKCFGNVNKEKIQLLKYDDKYYSIKPKNKKILVKK